MTLCIAALDDDRQAIVMAVDGMVSLPFMSHISRFWQATSHLEY